MSGVWMRRSWSVPVLMLALMLVAAFTLDFPFLCRALLVFGSVTAVACVLWVHRRALKEHRRVVEQLRQSREMLRLVMDTIPQRVFWKDTDLRYAGCNRPFAEDAGLASPNEVVGKTDYELSWQDMADAYRRDDREVIATGTPKVGYDERLVTADGECKWLRTSKVPLRNAEGHVTGVLGTYEDITARKQAETDRHTMEVQLRERHRLAAVGTLAAGVAHEINNPINGVMNYAQLIRDTLGRESPVDEFAAGIIAESERVAHVVRSLLEFSRQDKQQYSPARPADIVSKTLALLKADLLRENIELAVDVAEDLPRVRCRTQQIQQVLINLLTNARDALRERYPTYDPDKQIRICARAVCGDADDRASHVRFTVEDHGIGLTEETQERLFDPFFTTKDRSANAGLGLAISYGIVEEHGGSLQVESRPGLYTRVHVDLPVAVPSPQGCIREV